MKHFHTLLLISVLSFQTMAQPDFYFNVVSPSSVYQTYDSSQFTSVAQDWGWDGNLVNAVFGELVLPPEELGPGLHTLCDSVTEDYTGKFVMIDRGGCEFGVKALNAQDRGAIGVIILNFDETLIAMGPGSVGSQVNIPVIFIPQSVGAPLKAELNAGNTVVVGLSFTPHPIARIDGILTFDENENCVSDGGEPLLGGWKVKAEGGNFSRIALTKDDGHYQIFVDTGSYTMSVMPPSALWEACPGSQVTFTGYDSATVDLQAKAILYCPLMSVDIETPLLRRCFSNNNYMVHWCNLGTAVAEDAYVTVQFDDLISLGSSSIPYTALPDNAFEFQLGNVEAGECGSFNLITTVSCDAEFEQTLCAVAEIFPDTFCIPTGSWAGGSVFITGECTGDEVVFTIQNKGIGDMDSPSDYRVLKDGVEVLSGQFQLAEGVEEDVVMAADGATFRLEASQVAGYPLPTAPSSTVEACAPGGQGFSTGYFTMFPAADYGESYDEECEEVIGSYDPNDKQGFPKGYGEEHFVERNTGIQYLIRFQNTGTDTAFNIFIRDTLTQLLDLGSIRFGVASHPYSFKMIDSDILQFNFDNIMLPDSNVNEPGSHGFFTFTISQKPDLPLGSILRNSAAIYFDFNEPVITNETFHTIGENFIQVTATNVPLQPGITLEIFPNPIDETAVFDLGEAEFKEGLLQVYDLAGKLHRTQPFQHSNFIFNKGKLPPGNYFFKINLDGMPAATGKLLVVGK
jgi:PA domain-containing protein